MYYSNNANRNFGNQKSLEASLMENITINPIQIIQSVRLGTRNNKKWDAMNQHKNKEVVEKNVPQKSYKGKLSKSSLKSIKQDIENKEKELKTKREVAKEKSTLKFIEKLKHLEKLTDNSNFLDQTKEELDVGAKQLEELQKLLSNNLLKNFVLESRKDLPKIVENTRNDKFHQMACRKKVNKQLKLLQERYLNKIKTSYKSLKNIKNLTNSEHCAIDEDVNDNDIKTTTMFPKNVSMKLKKSSQNLPEKSLQHDHLERQTDIDLQKYLTPPLDKKKKTVSFKDEPQDLLCSAENKTFRNNSIDFTNHKPANLSTQFASRRKYAASMARLQVLEEELSSMEEVVEEESSSSEVEPCEDFNNIFFWNNNKLMNVESSPKASTDSHLDEVSQVQDEVTSACDADPKESLLNVICSDLDVGVRNSVLKSEYLSKEFSPDFMNKFLEVDKEEKKSMQLLGTTQGKFQKSYQLTNLKRRDQKLYTTF